MSDTGGAAPLFSTKLTCFAALARHHGVDLSPNSFRHAHALGAEEPADALLAEMARGAGFKSKTARLAWKDLIGLGPALPVIAVRDNGRAVVVIAVMDDGDGDGRMRIYDPTADVPGGRVECRWSDFAPQWRQGRAIFIKKRYAPTDPDQPFGLRWFIPELLAQRRLFTDVIIAALVLHVLGLATPLFVQLVIDRVLTHQTYSTLYVLTAGVAGAVAFEGVFTFLRRYVLLYASTRIDIRVAVRTFGHLLSLPAPFFDHATAGVLVQHLQQGERVRQFLTGRLFLTALDAVALVVFLPLLLLYSPLLTVVVLSFSAAIAAVIAMLIGPFRRRLQALYEAQGERQAMLVETLHGIRTIKSLALEPQRRRIWDRNAARTVDGHFQVGTVGAGSQAVTDVLEKLMTVAVVGFGAGLVFDNRLSVGELIAFQMIAARVTGPLAQIVGLVQEYQEVAVAARMLGRVMDQKPEEQGRTQRMQLRVTGEVTFERVGFRYGDGLPPALDQVSFAVAPGQTVGIVGRSGSGKSTLARMIQGVYLPQTGSVRLSGQDVRDLDLAFLRMQIGVVLQENFIFRATVRENIAMTMPGAALEAVVNAAQMAGADDFIKDLPQRYDTLLEENGANLSGGQRQRLAIARALLPRPPLLLLDEATSALDPESEAVVRRNLALIARDRTVIVITHRLSQLVAVDRILVLEQGRAVGWGTHGELLTGCAPYARLWAQQNAGDAS